MRYIWGLVGVAIGFGLIRYTFQLVSTFGRISWAEQHLGGGLGGTYTLYKIVGIVVIFLAMLYMFGRADVFVGPIAPLFGGLGN